MPNHNQLVNFEKLVSSIQQIHTHMTTRVGKAINISLSLRNWAIGAYIAEYQLRGEDRATYGDALLENLAEELTKQKVKTCGERQLYNYLKFYNTYPEICQSLNAKLNNLLPQNLHYSSKKVRTQSALSGVDQNKLLQCLSYSHIEHLIGINDPNKRSFYEIECIRGSWSVRELKRQSGSMYYERSGLSNNKEKLAEIIQQDAETQKAELAIRDPYVFEFLGLKPTEVINESNLEGALLNGLQEFLLELGHGFCFEARQKRILIGDTHGFIDLVFYHRILKCHVLIDLKTENFTHENIGQLNTYVSWYKENMMRKGDKQPIGILLCAQKNQALVKYALAGMDNNLFVSKYKLKLPSIKEIQQFLENRIKDI